LPTRYLPIGVNDAIVILIMLEVITRNQFEDQVADGQARLTFVGMSNSGKSVCSAALARDAGFDRVCCDDEIEAELGEELTALGYSGIQDMAKWMGQPYDNQYPTNSERYRDLEIKTMLNIILELGDNRPSRNRVIDTTGSVVHTGEYITSVLPALSTVVYLEATPADKARALRDFAKEPKPVFWDDVYQPEDDEEPEVALLRCHPQLVARRTELYRGMAHVVLPADKELRDMDGASLLERIRGSLAA
jgi:shikimate kinase